MFDYLKAAEVMARIGKPPNTARTPSEVIYRENKLRVLHYLPTIAKVSPTPILIVSIRPCTRPRSRVSCCWQRQLISIAIPC